MKYSFSYVPSPIELTEYESLIGAAESDGFDIVWTPDQGYMIDPVAALALALRRSSSLRMGLGVTSPFMRHPLQIARAAATLGNLAPDRFILGIGAGEKARIRDPIGAPSGRFIDILDDTFRALRGLLDGDRVSITNSVFHLDDVALEMPLRSSVPLYLATTAPSAFKLAGARADGVIVGDVSDPATMAEIVGWIASGAQEAGRSIDDIDIIAWVATVITDDRAAIWERLRRRVVGTAIAAMSKPTRRMLGVAEEHIPQIMAARRDDAAPLSKEAISEPVVDRFALVGDGETVARRIRELEEVGVTTMGFRMPVALQDHISFADNLGRLKSQVMSA